MKHFTDMKIKILFLTLSLLGVSLSAHASSDQGQFAKCYAFFKKNVLEKMGADDALMQIAYAEDEADYEYEILSDESQALMKNLITHLILVKDSEKCSEDDRGRALHILYRFSKFLNREIPAPQEKECPSMECPSSGGETGLPAVVEGEDFPLVVPIEDVPQEPKRWSWPAKIALGTLATGALLGSHFFAMKHGFIERRGWLYRIYKWLGLLPVELPEDGPEMPHVSSSSSESAEEIPDPSQWRGPVNEKMFINYRNEEEIYAVAQSILNQDRDKKTSAHFSLEMMVARTGAYSWLNRGNLSFGILKRYMDWGVIPNRHPVPMPSQHFTSSSSSSDSEEF